MCRGFVLGLVVLSETSAVLNTLVNINFVIYCVNTCNLYLVTLITPNTNSITSTLIKTLYFRNFIIQKKKEG